MRFLLKVSGIIDWLSEHLGRIVLWLVLVMTLLGGYNAIMRALDRRLRTQFSSNTYLELQWYLFDLIFLFMAAYALRHDAHVRVDALYGRLSERKKAWIDLLGSVLFLIPFCILVLYVSLPFVANSVAIREMSPDPGGLPRWPIKLAIPLAFGLLILQGISQIIKNWAFLKGLKSSRDEEGESQAEGI